MPSRRIIDTRIEEGSSPTIEGYFYDDESNEIIEAERITSIRVTVYEESTNSIVDFLNNRDILDTNGGSFLSGDRFQWKMLDLWTRKATSNSRETHVAVFRFTFDSNRVGIQEVQYNVYENMTVKSGRCTGPSSINVQ